MMSRDDKVWMIRAAALQGVLASDLCVLDEIVLAGNVEAFLAQSAYRVATAYLRLCDEQDAAQRKAERGEK